MAKVDAQLSTAVALNTLSAQNSLKGLTKAVKLSTDAWKINEKQLKSAGDYVGAVESKYKGLARTMELQQKHVDGLKAKQSALNVENKQDAAQFAKLTAEIGREQTKLDGLRGQYDKTGREVKYYKSGLAELQRNYKENNRLTESTVNRLEAEGKSRQANRVRAKGQAESIQNLNQQYKKQVAELKQVEATSGRFSSAYKNQKIRVNNTATAMAKAKKSTDSLNKAGKESHSIFKGAFLGNLGANVAIAGIGAVKSATVGLIKTGMEYNKEQDKMRGVWKALTHEAPKDGKALVGFINEISSKSMYASDTVNEMAQSFYHVHSSREETEKWTKSFIALGSTLQMSNAKMADSGEMFAKIVAGGNATAEDLNVMIDRFPMWGEAMTKTTGKSMKQLRAMSAAGKLTSKQFTETLDYLGKKYKSGTADSLKTYTGMSSYLKTRFQKLSGDVTKSSFKMSKDTISAIQQVTDDKSMDMYSHAISAAFTGAATVIAGALKVIVDHRKSIMAVIGDVLKLAGAIGRLGIAIGKVIGSQVAAGLKVLNSFIKVFTGGKSGSTLTDNIVHMLDSFSKNKTAVKIVADSIMGIAAFKGAKKTIQFSASVLDKTKDGIATVMDHLHGAKRKGAKVLHFASKVLDGTANGLHKMSVRVDNFNGRMKKKFSYVAHLVTGKFTKGLGLLKRGAAATGRGIKTALKATARIATKAAIAALHGLRKAAIYTGKGIKTAFNFLKANPLAAGIAAVVALGVALYALYKHNKKFRKFVNGIISACKRMARKAIKPVRSMVSSMKKIFNSGFKVIRAAFTVFADVFTGKWEHLGRHTKALVSSLWRFVKSIFKHGYNFLNTLTHGRLGKMLRIVKSVGSAIGKAWRATWNGLAGFFSSIWKKMKRIVKDGVNGVIKMVRGVVSAINGVIHMFGGKKTTISLPHYMHFATGTGYGARRAIDRVTPAVVNDGPEADNRETIIRANGDVEKPQGRNHETLLMPGDEVLNATESKEFDQQTGRAHFASGTGFWSGIGKWAAKAASGVAGWVSDKVASLKNLFTTATKVIANPTKAFKSMFHWSSAGMPGVLATMGKGLFNKATDAGLNWWKQLWSMVNLSGDGAGGGGWRHSPGSGWVHTSGFGYRGGGSGGQSMHDGNDFSTRQGATIHAVHGGKVVRAAGAPAGWGAVGYNIVTKDDAGRYVIYQEFGHASDSKVSKGDTVKTGQAIARLGRSGLGSGPHVHIGVSDNYPFNNSGTTTKGWLDLMKMSGTTKSKGKSEKAVKTDSKMAKLIKKQVGSGFWSMIKKIADKFGDDGGGSEGNPSGSSVARWRPYVVKALKANGFAATKFQVDAWMRVIKRESNGNPKAVNNWDSNARAGHPSKGLVQTITPTFNAYKFRGHGNILNGYDNLLAGIHYAKARYGKGNGMFRRVSGPLGYANGGIVTRAQVANIAEGNQPESIIPWDIAKRGRAYEILGKTVAHFAATDVQTGSQSGPVVSSTDLTTVLQALAQTNQLLAGVVQAIQDKPVLSQGDVYNATKTTATVKTKLNNYSKGRFGL